MARTIVQIRDSILAAKAAESGLDGLTSASRTAVWRLWAYITAVAMWTLEVLFDSHKAEVTTKIAAEKAHTLPWYRKKALAFQYGDDLPDGSDVYDPVRILEDDPDSFPVRQAAATEVDGRVRVKVAYDNGDNLEALSNPQMLALETYMGRIKDAGVRLLVTTGNGDDLRLTTNIYYDALVLDATGARLDGSDDAPVLTAIKTYLRNLPFNGRLVLNRLIDAIEAVDGVVIGEIAEAQARYGALPFDVFTTEYSPDAGYLILDEDYFDENITYTSHEPV